VDSCLIRAGITLIAFPAPIISDLVGSAIVAAGLVKRRLKQPTMADVYVEFTDTVKSLERIRQDLRY
jgi:hypothetical protein